MSVTKQQAAALYAAVFNRAPDQAGLNYWIEQESFNIMAESFVAHPVFTEQYGDLDNQAFVEAIYENVLLGQGDAEGIEFWVGALDAGLSRGEFLASFIDASLNYEGDDAEALLRKDALVNKVTVGLYYTDTFGEATNFPADADIGSADIVNSPVYQKAAAAIENVTADPETVEAAKAEIDREVESNELVNALETYQAALVAQTEADEAVTEALKAAVEGLSLEEPKANAEGVAGKVEELAGDALTASKLAGAGSLELNDATIQLARDQFTNTINLAQAEVDLLKAQNKAAVNLQEKIEAYNTVAEEINKTVTAFNAEAAKFAALNEGFEFDPTEGLATFEDQKLQSFDFGGFELTVKNGKVVAQKTEGGGEDAKKVDATAEFNELDGADAFAAQLVALNANTAKQANAQKAIEAATLQALKDEGYKVFEKVGEAEAKEVAWSKVKFEAGKLVAATVVVGTTYEVKTAKDATKSIFGEKLFDVPTICTDGEVYPTTAEIVSVKDEDNVVTGMPAEIADAAANSEKAVKALEDAKGDSKDFEDALKKYNDAVALQTALTEADAAKDAADEAVDAAAEAFTGLGYHLVPVEDKVATGELITNADEDPNLFVYNTDLETVNNFSGDDLFFFGDKAAALIVLGSDFNVAEDKLGGDNSVLEIFALQKDGNTVLYVEKTAFAGGSSTKVEDGSDKLVNQDLVKIELTGVQADELVFENGFLQF